MQITINSYNNDDGLAEVVLPKWSCRSYDIMILDNLPFPQLYTFFDNEPETSSLKSHQVPEILCFDEVTFSSKKLIYCKLTS